MAHWTETVKKLERLKSNLELIAANEMVNDALDNIRAESYEGRKWKKRKAGAPRNEGRGLLVDSGAGRRSINAKKTAPGKASLTANDYMQAHNEGVQQNVNVRAHSRTRKGRTSNVKSFTRDMNLPERRFSGKGKKLIKRIEKVFANEIVKACS